MYSIVYFLKNLNLINKSPKYVYRRHYLKFSGCTQFQEKDLTIKLKHDIEKHWRNNLGLTTFNPKSDNEKFYVLSMFPYPSGNLHMGHVRVYTISDAMARFYRMTGKNVLHPMGWDAFGLPAENAAIERKIPADQWTKQNIVHMKEQLYNLGFSFDWTKEVATCDPSYYKWTQWLFLKMYKSGIAYKKEALVNWDPVDKTVLADEQVDENQCSWRSGAKVEKKLLKQWFIKTTKFAKSLFDGLDDPSLIDWRDIITLQKHWIGECTGYSFDLKIKQMPNGSANNLECISVWTEKPELLMKAAFIAVSKEHILNEDKNRVNYLLDNVEVINVFDENRRLPIIVTDQVEFPLNCDSYIGAPSVNESDQFIADQYNISYLSDNLNCSENSKQRQNVIEKAINMNIGGYLVSSKLKDWLISRQRRWGTPIPIIYCDDCGVVPVPECDLPVILSFDTTTSAAAVKCPKCHSTNAHRELDTMDTFVDSSWYFLRYLDVQNKKQIFDATIVSDLMPVDLYIGGKEHAVLHLYYARFMCHFLHSIGMSAHAEPFQRLLVQGMVMGRTYRIKGTGKYLQENEIKITNEKKNQAIEIASGNAVVMQWEKMSKSKMNGVDPNKMIEELSCDTLRLIVLGDVAPTSHRNWSRTTFPGIINWQKRLWLLINEFNEIRTNDIDIGIDIIKTPEFEEQETKMFDARNYYIKGTTFNYMFSHQLSVALSKMQGLTNSLRKASKEQKKYGKEYELTLATLIKMMAPMAPHFASELWCKFLLTPNRTNTENTTIKWDKNVLEQSWPNVDKDYKLDLRFKVNGMDISTTKYTNDDLAKITHEKALNLALNCNLVIDSIGSKSIVRTKYDFYTGCNAIVSIFVEHSKKRE